MKSKPETDTDLVNRPTLYMSTLRNSKEETMTMRTRNLGRSSTLVKYLPISEQADFLREANVLANWQVNSSNIFTSVWMFVEMCIYRVYVFVFKFIREVTAFR